MRLSVRLTVVGAACALGLLIAAPGASATQKTGGARTCSTSNYFVGVSHRATGLTTTYTDGVYRAQVNHGGVLGNGYYESSFHYIGSWERHDAGHPRLGINQQLLLPEVA